MPARSRAARPAPPPPPPDSFPPPTQPLVSLPRPTRNLELPRPAAPTTPIELPPRRTELPGPAESIRADAHRTEPGTWREIIARFERELGAPMEPAEPGQPTEPALEPDVADAAAAAPGAGAASHVIEPPATEPPALEMDAERAEDADDADAEATPSYTPPSPDEDDAVADEPLQHPMPWEFEAMTTPDYRPPQSIHDPEHDSWPVEAEDGAAIPAWSDEEESDVIESRPGFDDQGLDQVAAHDPWDVDEDADPVDDSEPSFPINAFIVPAGVDHVPAGYDDTDVAHRVAHRLDELARLLRDDGLGALGSTHSTDELSQVLAAIVTGYVARNA